MSPVRIGVIGAGGIAVEQHIPGYKTLGDQIELVAVADLNGARAAEVAAKAGFARSYESFEQMLALEQLDAVSVCTPNKFHATATIAALRAGVHVLCEKPPARTAHEAEEMARTAQESGRILMYLYNQRFKPETMAARRFINGGELGEVYMARAHWRRRRGIPGWGVFTNKELQGGGPLIDIGVHVLDLALHLMGYPEPELVVGSTYRKLGMHPAPSPMGQWDHTNFEIEDLAAAFIRLRNGATILLEASFMEHMEQMDLCNVQLSGTRGGINLYPFQLFKDMHETIVNVTPAWLPKQNGHAAEIANFVGAIQGKEEPAVTPEEGVRLQRILDAVYKSAETGDPVRF